MTYEPGDRVWILMEGYTDWWPARVAADAELPGPRSSNCDLTVFFYPGSTTESSVYELNTRSQAEQICFFETSSEKAVTKDTDLLQAITNAAADETANPLKLTRRSRARRASSAAALEHRRMQKRPRTHTPAAEGSGPHSGAPQLSVATLSDIAQEIQRAVAAGDVPTLRLQLRRLDGVDVMPSDLNASKIGVAVGSVCGSEACRPLWPLCRALVAMWARNLPQETIQALQRLREGDPLKRKMQACLAVQVGPNFVHSPMTTDLASPTQPSFHSPNQASPLSKQLWESTNYGSPTLTPLGSGSAFSPTVRKAPMSKFFERLCLHLNSPNSSTPVSNEQIEKVATELRTAVVSSDDRMTLLSRLQNPELSFVRENLLSERWTAQQYLAQPDDVFVTEKEKEKEKQRVDEKLKAADRAKNAFVNKTNFFECKNCGKRECHFYEQQTRGADEPTTKFITCLLCDYSWKEE
ncbi:transcription elongation factor S-II [Strigomonas culicis]|uniref:Transcription elongation factor S-II n=1 Tax=Strigomonas culicis TaxID=28005 RepID=S9WFX6_9TRYP|nr:transcription elongation factor S-II [Strigomonas culicis]|eukprot:EPY34620.1 transcription elongation factor S-II [Strigomonas culicis]